MKLIVQSYVFADETALVMSHEKILMYNSLLQIDIITLQKWYNGIKLIINKKQANAHQISSS